ncbi:MAG: hypothetical protein COA71_06530 [SAR86 cluster bacterium]|uniref:Uncharacterized protein n=1 Tax=SAR86 cluster bacterium TaxID=2030880 RepID=A0A2A5CEE9_9GAMM|nr:MAG: hypothetical protein COA71_06530 [SAR86 cluster bacterium]
MISLISLKILKLKSNIKVLALVLALVFLNATMPASLSAHHSTSMFDTENIIDVSGVVVHVDLKNPHSLIYIVAIDEEGNEVQWVLEAEPLSTLASNGWTSSTLSVGDEVIAFGGPARNGSRAMILRAIQLPDGRVMRT